MINVKHQAHIIVIIVASARDYTGRYCGLETFIGAYNQLALEGHQKERVEQHLPWP